MEATSGLIAIWLLSAEQFGTSSVDPHVKRPAGISALSFFLGFGTTMSALAAASLAFPSAWQRMWSLNPRGHEGLAALGLIGIGLMTAVSIACLAAALGLWHGRPWGRQLAAIILVVNAGGDLLNAMIARDPRTLIGLPVAGAILYYLRTDRVRAFFEAAR